jgi:hypothetical protein
MPRVWLNKTMVPSAQTPPKGVAGPAQVGAASAPSGPQAGPQADERQRDQPGDLAADLGVEHAQQTGAAPEEAAAGDGAGGGAEQYCPL